MDNKTCVVTGAAGSVLFLASHQSSSSTGSVFMADGGLNA